MNPDPLPPDLRDLEAQLAQRSRPEPSPDFRARVLHGMTTVPAAPVSPYRSWRLVWRAAAALVVALNLALSATNAIRFQRLKSPESNSTRPTAVVETDDGFQRFAASALATLKPAPDAGVLSRQLFHPEEKREWAMP